jgi:diguanylate cyclase (GGDEF)-like protein
MQRIFLAELKLPKWIIFSLGLVAVVLLGLLEYLTGYAVNFSVFYFFPVAFVGWHAGMRWACTLAAAGAVASVIADGAAGFVYSGMAHEVRDAGITFCVLAAIAYLFSSLKTTLDRESARSRVDTLTGAASPRHFMEVLGAEVGRAQRYEHALALAYLDLDGFKAVNDTYGHAAGDEVLRRVVVAIRRSIRETDVLARMGGDEFALLLPETDLTDAEATLRKLHAVLQETALEAGLPLGFSAGVVGGPPPQEDAETILGLADQLMYEAKAAGKGRWCAHAFPPRERREASGVS